MRKTAGKPRIRNALLALCIGAGAAAVPQVLAAGGEGAIPPVRQEFFNSGGFNAAHPDVFWRRKAIHEMDRGRDDVARDYLRKAARFADKPSQAMLAEMLWTGRGGERDRARAYAWMDLAAQRAYPVFLAKREAYWAALGEAERKQVLRIGPPLFDEYSDAAAKPRLERELVRAKRKVTGSRVGSLSGGLVVMLPDADGWGSGSAGRGSALANMGYRMQGADYYAPEYWEPERYWAREDAAWRHPKVGVVTVQDPEAADTDEAADP